MSGNSETVEAPAPAQPGIDVDPSKSPSFAKGEVAGQGAPGSEGAASKGDGGAFSFPDGGDEKGDADGKDDGGAFSFPGDGDKKGDADKGSSKKDDKGGNKDDDAGSDKEGKDADGPPEQYEDFSLPEGYQVTDTSMMDEFKAECRELGLTQQAAQSRLENLLSWQSRQAEQTQRYWEEQSEKWTGLAKQEGVYTKEHFRAASEGIRAADTTGELASMLHSVGLDRHPALIKAFGAYAELNGTDRDVATSGSATQGPLTPEQKLYGAGAHPVS